MYRLSNSKWKKYHEPKFLRNERKTIEKRLLQIISRLESPAVEIRNRPIHNQPQNDYLPDWQFTGARNFEGGYIPNDANQPSTSTARPEEAPMEEGEISSDSEMAPSVLEVPTINWANYLGIKSVQYIKMGHAPRIQAIEPNNWDHENRQGNRKRVRNGPPVINDGNDKRPEAIENTRMLRKKAIRQHPRGIQPIQAEIIHKMWISILRRENYCARKSKDNRHLAPPQRTPSN